MYEVIPNNRIRKMPEKLFPHPVDYESSPAGYNDYSKDCDEFLAEQEKQPQYPISGDHNWKVGDKIEEGKDFKLARSYYRVEDFDGGFNEVAVPIASSPSVQYNDDMETDLIIETSKQVAEEDELSKEFSKITEENLEQAIKMFDKPKEEEDELIIGYKNWCKETKRNGGVVIGKSIYEFLDYLKRHYTIQRIK